MSPTIPNFNVPPAFGPRDAIGDEPGPVAVGPVVSREASVLGDEEFEEQAASTVGPSVRATPANTPFFSNSRRVISCSRDWDTKGLLFNTLSGTRVK